MKLYDLSWCPWARRVTIYLKEKGIANVEVVSLRYGEEKSPQMLQKNPLGFLPFLELEDGHVLMDSMAIVQYLEERFPSPSLVGRTPEERCRLNAYLAMVNEFFVRSVQIHTNRLPQFARTVKQSAEAADWLQPSYDRTLATLESLSDDHGPFLLGERLTLADCALYPMHHYQSENFQLDVFSERHPKLRRWAAMFATRASAPCPLRDDGLRELGEPPLPLRMR